MFKHLKIKAKIVLPIVLTGVILFSVASFYYYFFSTRILKTAVNEHLNAVVTSRAHHVDTFLEEQKTKIELMASSSIFKNVLKIDNPDYKIDFEKASDRLKKIVEVEKSIYELFILDAEGIVICSSVKEDIGLDKSKDDYYINGLKETYIKDAYYSKSTKKNSLAISSPIVCEDNECKGIIVARIETSLFDEITMNNSDFGETGEIFLINQEGYMITPSRFKEDTFLKQKIDSLSAKDCLSKFENSKIISHNSLKNNNEIIEIFNSYRGVNVLGDYHPSHVMNWCMMSEISESEVLEPINRLLIIFEIIIIIVLFLFFIVVYLLAKSISKPIIILRKETEKIKKGSLNSNIKIDRKDEIGELAESINVMANKLKESNDKIEKKIKDRTKDLEDVNKLMIGRELKMMELKKEIIELKNRLKKKN